jgi:molecular chaperone GrpE
MFNKKKKEEEEVVSPNVAEQLNENTEANTTEEQAEAVSDAEEVSVEDKLKQEIAELNDKYLRLFAEFDNFKRRTQKERIELLQTAGKDVILSLLPILDDFERGLDTSKNASDVESVREGILLIHSKLKGILEQRGLKEISSVATDFDTDLHEAITQIPSPSEDQKGKVIDEVQKGYTLNDKVIRYAKVVVGA